MTHGSLFSGIGGFDLAAAWAGWTNVFNCEIDPFCRRVLKYHFPESEHYEDIRTTDFTVWRDRVDVLTGGFPCQPFSLAGKRKGTADARACSADGAVVDADGLRCEKQFISSLPREPKERSRPRRHDFASVPNWEGFPTESPICGPDDGLSAGLDGITFPAWRRESIKAYGNAIVPQVALRIFETINEYEGL